MNYSAIATRYSKALFTLSKQKGELENVYNDILLIKSVCETEQSFRSLLDFPVLKAAKKISIFNDIFADKVNGITLNFLKLTANNKRESHLLLMCYAFVDFYKKEKGIKIVNFTSVEKISDDIRTEIIAIVKKHYKSEIELVENTTDDIIGGFVLRVEDEQYDASVSSKLKNIERELIDS